MTDKAEGGIASKIKGAFDGKKTKLVAGGLVALGVALFFGWVELTPEQIAALVAILMGAGKFALRLAVEKIADKNPEAAKKAITEKAGPFA